MNIEVVLTENDPKLGKRGDVVRVSSGFANNFLFPHKKALPATPANLKSYAEEKAKEKKLEAERLEEAKALAQKLKDFSLTLAMDAGDGDKLYGAINSQAIAEALAKQNFRIERKDIHLDEPIKKLGSHEVAIKLHRDISIKLKISVVKKS